MFVLENQTAPRGGAAPPVPIWERGGPLDPQEVLRILNIWDPQNQVMGTRRSFCKEGSHLRAGGGTSDPGGAWLGMGIWAKLGRRTSRSPRIE